ncbi:hypothetical protein DAEQUDRAFT_661722 [Daedalea quercina L-15889]|uniref:BTB domain-containing protein n=1 Tax=Daedalea quercina L-15889 TaxID=1314783 RepID=A0A165TTU5_9APHY|nr:hypothetical protein DAEQUDRAFT_661722 [Daedalea quercina L-15889]
MAELGGAAPVIPPTALAIPPSVGLQGPGTSTTTAASPEPEPSRKRKRVDPEMSDGCENKMDNEDKDEKHVVPVHDEKYYDEGADCVVRVENTLFRVHRFLLARDSSVFQDMFTLPTGEEKDDATYEGFSDEQPIRLYSESVENFRIFLSVLYALPDELHAYRTATADISRLLTIASLTNKYHFLSTAWWAVSAIYSVTSGEFGPPTHPMGDLSRASTSALVQILEIAMRCGHRRLIDFVVESWSNRILSKDLTPRPAMRVADRWDLAALRGVAYYVQLMEMGREFEGRLRIGPRPQSQEIARAYSAAVACEPTADKTSTSELVGEDEIAPLTSAQLRRLLSGFYSLVTLWDNLRLNPPALPRPDGCTYHMHACVVTFRTVWCDAARSEKTARYGTADVVGRLCCVEDQLRASTDLACTLSPGCKREAMDAVKKCIKDVQEGLSARFVDLTATGE